MHTWLNPTLVATVLLILVGCSKPSTTPDQPSSIPDITEYAEQAVAMPDSFAATVAMDILDKGGNAVDAAIAAQFSLAVTLPEAGNIGGGGFMVIHYENENTFIDYRETAPQAAHRDMYLDENGEVKSLESIYGILASGVPGTVSGMWKAHQKYGSLPWETLLAPAVSLARDGFIVPEKLARNVANYIKELESENVKVNFTDYFGEVVAGEIFIQPALAKTLERIQNEGLEGFYGGKTAQLISQFMQKHEGLITQADLANYEARWREPIISDWRDYQLVSAAPPSSGGIAVSQWLRMYDIVKAREGLNFEHNSAEYIHVLAEIGKRVFADRAEYLGDPDFYEVPKTDLLNNDYLIARAADISLGSISNTEDIEGGLAESEQTTHFSIVDKFGNAVSNTTTINLSFGSGMVVEGAGFLLNDEMDDFSVKAGVPNYFGAIGGVANEIQPNKRMLSSMTPTIVLKDNKLKMVTGSPGGTTILSSVYLSILHAIEFNLPIQEVVDAPRFHHQLLPKDEIRYHQGLSETVVSELAAMGYTTRTSRFGDVHVIVKRNGKLEAASESNGRGLSMVKSLQSETLAISPETPALKIFIDTNGDHNPDTDAQIAGKTAFAGGLYHGVVLHNADDDDGDNVPDDADSIVNGAEDLKDLFPIKIDSTAVATDETIRLNLSGPVAGEIGLFHLQSDGRFIELNTNETIELSASALQQAPMLYVEGRKFANEQWNGHFSLSFSTMSSSTELELRVAPWLMLSNASEAEVMFIREHEGRNDKMIEQLLASLPKANTKLHIIPASANYPTENIWLQDTMEIGRQYTPFKSMPVVLQANRNKGIDNFSKDVLLGPDFGWIQVGDYREKYAIGIEGVGWMDWFGNLEVSPPLPSYPHGRMYYGEAGEGNQLDPRIVSKIAAQALQAPFTLDVSYLIIKHADETLSWVPGKDGRWYALVPSPREMLKLAQTLQDNGHGDLPMLTPFEEAYSINTLLSDSESITRNMQIEDGPLAKNIETIKRELGIEDDQFIKVPSWINENGSSLIPNMVNSVVVNGMFIAPEPHGPTVDGLDAIEQDFIARMANAEVDVIFVDDQQYHRWWGNVHCATNVTRNGSEHVQALMAE